MSTGAGAQAGGRADRSARMRTIRSGVRLLPVTLMAALLLAPGVAGQLLSLR
ncbi:hypothetical protein CLV35_2427 [Motilibacter peucedani]|uniref:Uncharacterized protein n=1 Tax=Motilibacter peucedani TaxID=598650 RepID=A0A420XP06_9ACTN|nr:hypothetical protein CLV35_2427 [Motilibacter peucedani]